MDEQTLELQIKSKAQEAKASIDSLIKGLTNVENVLTNIYLEIGNIEKKSEQSIPKTKKEVDNLQSSTEKATTSANKLGKALSLGGAYVGVKRLTNQFLQWMNLTVDKTEQLNLFNVVFKNIEKDGVETFSTLGREATNFQNRLNEAFGTNQTETLKYQALFKSMGDNQGIPEQYSALISETMTKFTYDLASLYNKNETTTAEALRAGVFSGQTKPVRNYGLDITQTSMQPILDSLGIDRQIKELSQAEKMLLRYIAVLRQGQVAMGDFANTVESPANQIKVFKQQLVEAKVAFTSLFIGTFGEIMPYANALLMVIKEVSLAIADMFGIKISDYNSGIASQEDAYFDLGDSIDGATESVKELKKQTLGFDEIHNINENQNNGGSGVGTTGGIDQRLLDAITGYDNGMDNVRMKATEIRDRIMEWLGFTKEIDPLTGNVSWKFKDTNSILYKIVKTLGDIYTNGKKVVSEVFGQVWDDFKNGPWGDLVLGALNAINDCLKFIGKNKSAQTLLARILEIATGFKLLKLVPGVKNLTTAIGKAVTKTGGWLSPLKDLYKSLDNVNFSNKTFFQGLKEGFSNWSSNLTGLDRFKLGITGITEAFAGISSIKIAMEDISQEGLNFNNTMGLVAGSISNITGCAQVGTAILPGWGTLIGAAVGAVGSLLEAIKSYKSESELYTEQLWKEKEAQDEALKSLRERYDEIDKNRDNEASLVDNHKALYDELLKIVDANGKVKEGYEDRAAFILGELNKAYGTEYTMIDGEIKQIDKLKDTMDLLIAKKKAMIYLNAAEARYEDAIENRKTTLENYSKAQQEQQQIISEYGDKIYNVIDTVNKLNYAQSRCAEIEKELGLYGAIHNEEYIKLKATIAQMGITLDGLTQEQKNQISAYIATEEKMKSCEQQLGDYAQAELDYTELTKISTYESAEAINSALNDIDNRTSDSLDTRLSKNIDYYSNLVELEKGKNGEIEDGEKTFNQKMLESLTNQLVEQSQTIDNLSDDVISAWGTLSQKSSDEFLSAIGKLPNDVRTNIIDKMKEKGYQISDELQKGIDSLQPVVKVTADTKQAELSLDTLFSSIKSGKYSNVTSGALGFLWKKDGGVFSDGKWKNIQQYANGGAPSHGTLFWAGEHGAEVVAHANGRTEVLNQSQIASTIYSAMISAMSQFGGQTSQIDVHVHTDEGTVIDRINQKTIQTGSFPLTIPVE